MNPLIYCDRNTIVGTQPPRVPGFTARQSLERWLAQPANIREPWMRVHGCYFSRWHISTSPQRPSQLRIKHRRCESDDEYYNAATLRRIQATNRWDLIPGYEQCIDHRDQQMLQDCVAQWLQSLSLTDKYAPSITVA